MKNFFYYITIFLLLIIFFNGCSTSSDKNIQPITDGFNRESLLENITTNIILPAHNNLANKLVELENSNNEFAVNTNTEKLTILRQKWVSAYKAWQYVEMFNIGKAEEIYYYSKMNTYPTNSSRIEANILSDEYDLINQQNNFAAQGFPALDYMLYGINNDSTLILEKYVSNEGTKYIKYLTALIEHMLENTNTVIEFWNSEKEDFIQSTENTATSSLNMLTNDFIYYYEKGLRANKVGIPAGVFSSILTDRVEAYYRKDISKILLLEALDACKNFFIGKNFLNDQTGESLKTYLDYVNQESNLSTVIINKFDNAKEKIMLLDNNFVSQIETNNLEMLYAYDAIQEGVVKLKTDMLSILSINVDYFDADGD